MNTCLLNRKNLVVTASLIEVLRRQSNGIKVLALPILFLEFTSGEANILGILGARCFRPTEETSSNNTIQTT